MTTYDKIGVKKADLKATEAALVGLKADLDRLVQGPGYAARKDALLAQIAQVKQTIERLGRDLNRWKLAAHETGQADAWQYNHDQAAAALAELERPA
ncbi:hypothetical protein [Hymenobacter sp. PAMC 26628]|uniref:hypothetical protein n=1 Tax=Hymenobacter sp. PAMC 26628 TaxID=1484118 RepID=UPI0012FFB29C|nr:hypothetical protein [Hymenobacter sp. PAMC 26628]